MVETNRNLVQENEDKIRCVNYLLQMLEKYGSEIKSEEKEQETIK